jgi:N-acyl-D-aspartate/D-glutamate deacylase
MITADQYPFLQGSPIETITELVAVPEGMEPLSTLRKTVSNRATPIEAREDARRRYVTELQRALGNPEARRRLRKSTYERRPDYPGFVARWGWQDFRIKVAPKNPELVDRMIIDIIEEQNRDGFDVLADLIMREPAALFASSSQSAEDMRHAMVQEWVMISSDGGALPVIADGASPVHDHPRPFASQAIVLRKYVREEGLLTLEEAIRKMTSLPAQVMKIGDRGLLLEGYRADIAVFDAETVRDNAAYDNAYEYATGIEYVVVNGKVSVERGGFTGDLNGRVLLKSGAE